MATLALSVAGQVIGGAVGGPIGATIGRAVGALAGSAIDSAIFGEKPVQRPGADVRLTGSSEGGAIPRVYGWSRVSGNIIWATELERLQGETSGSKGLGRAEPEQDVIAANFALALCEGEVAHLGRIWADGKLLETDGLDIRFYRGTDDQQPDGMIAAKQGVAPAYRGLCYLVFEGLELTPFGNRIPNISVEICRPVGDLEGSVRAVCVIPGSTEYGYDPVPRVQIVGPGRTAAENTHVSGVRSNWDVSIDELTALCPKLEHVGLVVAWFGTDLRCAQCVVEPRVEGKTRQIKDASWSVAGVSRDAANVVSSHAGGPAYGGTPSDDSVKRAIADLRARGIKVTLYPFVMMDVAAGNGRVDPYTLENGQPAYPWRGRITCHPAPGVAGSPDGTAAAAGQVAAFMDNGYRAMVHHYAHLSEDAGGVDAFVIGSEMRHMTWVRSGPTAFPFVDALRTLAGEVRGVVGPGTKLTYAADWSEYSGYQPKDAPGDKIFHLDPLWADANIDAIGIDNYMPLADWRDGLDHLDAQSGGSIYDLDYLSANISGGEGYDWFYASAADRATQVRTPIADGLYGEHWIWRFKDLRGFWGENHHNRVGGTRSATATDWVPQSKPIWLTELGCGAVDKGPNAPNAFGDPKSAEDKRPYFSSGAPDALVQRQALRASHRYWQAEGAHNPVSQTYGGPMLDPDRIYLWCWDARPFPAFPTLKSVWSDAANYATGHWLNGRLGAAGADEILQALASAFDVPVGRIDSHPPLVTGMVVETVASMREVSASLVETVGYAVAARVDGVSWIKPDLRDVAVVGADDLMRGDGPLKRRKRSDPSEVPGRLTLSYVARARDYQTATVLAVAPVGERNTSADSALVLEGADAQRAARESLMRLHRAGDTLDVVVPPSHLALEAGDLMAVAGVDDGPFLVGEVRDGAGRAIGAAGYGDVAVAAGGTDDAYQGAVPAIPAVPVVTVAHLPDGAGGTQLVAAAYAEPWPGDVVIRDQAGGVLARMRTRGALGELAADLTGGPTTLWARGEALDVVLYGGHLSSADPLAALAGANRLAVARDDGGWEVIGFETATLIAVGRYRLTGLLRGLRGTLSGSARAGNRVMVLDAACERVPVGLGDLESTRTVRAFAGPRDGEGLPLTITIERGPAIALAPVHLSANRQGDGDVVLAWVRRSRIGGNDWPYGEVPLDIVPERYRVSVLKAGAVVRQTDVDGPVWTYGASEQATDLGAPGPFAVRVQQISPVHGPGHTAYGEVS